MNQPKGYILVTRLQRTAYQGGGDSGSVRLSTVHLSPMCQHMNLGDCHGSIVVVNLAGLKRHPILSQLGVCGTCNGMQWEKTHRRQASAH